MSIKKPNDYVYFVFLDHGLSHYSFTGYTDSTGEYRFVEGKKDQFGNPIPMRFNFNKSSRQLKYHSSQKAIIEFLRNHPECEGSANSHGTAMFRELNENKDAEIAIQATMLRSKAETKVLALKGAELKDAAHAFGYFKEGDGLRLHYLLQIAYYNPDQIFDVLDAPDFKAKALFKLAVDKKLVIKKGVVYVYKEEKLGPEERDAVSKLLQDKDLFDAIAAELKRTV
jgi:hypothetical protein